jgi:hypothetical protein
VKQLQRAEAEIQLLPVSTAAILDFSLPVTSHSIGNNIIELLILRKRRYRHRVCIAVTFGGGNMEKYEYFRFTAAILDFRLPVMSGSLSDSTVEFLDPENTGVAVGIVDPRLEPCTVRGMAVLPRLPR